MAPKNVNSSQPFVNALNAPFANGSLTFDLSQTANIISNGQVAPRRVSITLDATGKAPTTAIWFNDQLNPSGTTYLMQLFDSGGNFAGSFGQVVLSGTSPLDLSTIIPTSISGGSISFPGPVLLNPANNALQTITGPLSLGTNSITAGSAIIGGATASPWIDVTHPTYGAKCDGLSNDAVAFQAAINACHALNSACRVTVPAGRTCVIASGLTIFTGVTIAGMTEHPGDFSTVIKYTGTGTTPAISCTTPPCANSGLKDIGVMYTSASFTGALVSNTGAGSTFFMDGVFLTSVNSLMTNAAYLLDLTNSNSNSIWRSSMGSATKGINGTNSNLINIRDCTFGGGMGPITTTYIDKPGQALEVSGTDFEFIGVPTTAGPIVDCGTGTCIGSSFTGNWIGDFPNNWVGSIFKGTHGMSIAGNTFAGPVVGAGGTLFNNSATGSTGGYSVNANYLSGNWAVILNHNTAINGIDVTGNFWNATITTFITGSTPSTGMIVDNVPKTSIYADAAGHTEIYVNTFGMTAWDTTGIRNRSNGVIGWVSSGTVDPGAGVNVTGFSSPTAGFSVLGNGNSADSSGIFASDGNTVALTADWTCGTGGTVASCVAAQIVGSGGGVPLTFTLPLVARSWTWECDLVVGQTTGVTSNQWNILTATNGATNVTANYIMGTAATAVAVGAVTDQTSTTTTFQIAPNWTLGGTGTKMPVHIWGRVEGVSASGTVLSLQLLAPTIGDLVTIYRGSGCRVR